MLAAALIAIPLAGCGGGEGGSTRQEAPPARPRPNPHPGSKAAAPAVPTSPEGDNSIQVYGVEASDLERARASRTVRSYLDARAAGDWAKACAHLAPKPRAEQVRLAPRAGSCAKAMTSYAEDADPAVLREEARIEVLSLRVDPPFAFLIYRRSDGTVWATALERQGEGWKIVSVTPTPVG